MNGSFWAIDDGQRRLQELEKFEDIFDRMLKLREQIARNAGFNIIRIRLSRPPPFDYTAQDCRRFHMPFEQEVMPVLRE